VVIGRKVVEHLKDPVSFLRSIRHILRRDGLVALEVPEVQLWMRYGVIGTFFPERLSYFSRLSLGNLVTSIGFDIVSMTKDMRICFLWHGSQRILKNNQYYSIQKSCNVSQHC